MTAALAIGAINPCARRTALERLRRITGSDPVRADGPPSLLAFTRLLEVAAEAAGRADLGLVMADCPMPRETGVMDELFRHAPTLGQALQDLARFFPVIQSGTRVRLSRHADQARFDYAIVDRSVGETLQDAAYTLGRICRALERAAGAGWTLDAVTMSMPGPRSAAAYERFFRAPVRFAAPATALCFPARCLDAPIAGADARRYAAFCRTMGRLAPARPAPSQLEDALRTWLAGAWIRGEATLEHAAADFGTTPRTLQRRLKDRGLGFERLRAQQRMESAERLLRQRQLSITRIAEQLGFSEASAFTRAFRLHARQSPRAFRERCLAEEIVATGQDPDARCA